MGAGSDLPVFPGRKHFIRQVLRTYLYQSGEMAQTFDMGKLGRMTTPLQCGYKDRDIDPC